jgi:hypothetical protein
VTHGPAPRRIVKPALPYHAGHPLEATRNSIPRRMTSENRSITMHLSAASYRL